MTGMIRRGALAAAAGTLASVLTMGAAFAQSTPQFAQPTGSQKIYANMAGTWHWVPSAPLFLAMGGQWSQVRKVSVLSGPVGGPVTALRAANQSTVYQVNNGTLHAIASANQFHTMGYHFNEVAVVSHLPFTVGSPATISGSSSTPTARFIKLQGSGTVYYNLAGTWHRVPSAAMFLAMGGQWNQIQTVSALPSGTTTSPVNLVQVRGQSAVYEMGPGGHAHNVPSASIFLAHGWQWNQIVTVSHLPGTVGSALPRSLPSLASQVSHTVATPAQIRADLNNPKALALLKWTANYMPSTQPRDTAIVQNALGSVNASSATTQKYAETFIYASGALNASIVGIDQAHTQGIPTNVAKINSITLTSVPAGFTGSTQHTRVYYYRVDYTTTRGTPMSMIQGVGLSVSGSYLVNVNVFPDLGSIS